MFKELGYLVLCCFGTGTNAATNATAGIAAATANTAKNTTTAVAALSTAATLSGLSIQTLYVYSFYDA